MSKEEMRRLIESASQSASAPAVKVIPEGKRAIDPAIRHCQCGCRGDWTDHTMHLGERGLRAAY